MNPRVKTVIGTVWDKDIHFRYVLKYLENYATFLISVKFFKKILDIKFSDYS